MAKAKNAKRERKAPVRVVVLPLDDLRWQPVAEIHKRLTQHTGSANLAALDLTEKLRGKSVRCMRRNVLTGEREEVPSTFWADYKLDDLDGLRVLPRALRRDRVVPPIHGWVFYVWQPDCAKAWPALSPQADEGTTTREKSGTKPRGDWQNKLGAWLVLKAIEDARQLENVDALVEGAVTHLQEEIGWAPQTSGRIRAKILDFLQLLRR
jgi:hypothetical protein